MRVCVWGVGGGGGGADYCFYFVPQSVHPSICYDSLPFRAIYSLMTFTVNLLSFRHLSERRFLLGVLS